MKARQRKSRNAVRRAAARLRFLAAPALCGAALSLPVNTAMSAPIELAIFEFELEDFSAGAGAAAWAPVDAEQLARVTAEVRQLLARSGRYRPVDTGMADAVTARMHTLRDCDGCDAAIALKLGAAQSFVGVVRRISRTEYVVRFQVRDARTGAVISGGDSGLRMGANDSWSRGAVRLVTDRLLQPAR